MARTLVAIVIGYVLMAGVVMLAFVLALRVPDFAFQPGTAAATAGLIGYSLVIGFIAAALAGYVAARLAGAKRRRATLGLAALTLVLGLASAIGETFREPPPPSLPPEVLADPVARAHHGVQPLGYAFTLPVVGVLGVLAGGWWRRSGNSRVSSCQRAPKLGHVEAPPN